MADGREPNIHTEFCGKNVRSEEWSKIHVTNKDLVIKPSYNMESYYRGNSGQQLIGSGQVVVVLSCSNGDKCIV